MILVTELENLHTGALTVSRETLFMSEEKAQAHKSWKMKRLSSMHMRSDYRLSRLYFQRTK